MTELLLKNSILFIKPSNNPKRTTDATIIGVSINNEIIQLNSNFATTLISTLIDEKILHFLENYTVIRKEPRYGNHRFDLLLRSSINQEKENIMVELKSTTKVERGIACFPDAVSLRATNHVKLLTELSKNFPCILIFCIYRNCIGFQPCEKIDPEFAKTFRLALKSKLKIFPLLFENRIRKINKLFVLEVRYVKQISILQ